MQQVGSYGLKKLENGEHDNGKASGNDMEALIKIFFEIICRGPFR